MKRSAAPFQERFPWLGGDLQIIATRLLRSGQDLAGHSGTRMRFVLNDGDVLLGMLDQPAQPKTGRPLVVLLHGVPGNESSPYMLRMSRHLLDQGHAVLRMNLRGAGPSRAGCRGQYYAGSSEDLRELLAQLPPDLMRNKVVAVGYSLGGAILLKYLGEEGTRTPLSAAATVSAPIDLRGACDSLMRFRNTVYHFYLVHNMKREAMAEGAALSELERWNIRKSRTLLQYDDLFTAPRNGFDGAADYYARCSAREFLPHIRVDTLVVASLDDPWVPGSAYVGHYWGSTKNLAVEPLLSRRGGHVGFHGVGQSQPWSDRAVAAFIASRKT